MLMFETCLFNSSVLLFMHIDISCEGLLCYTYANNLMSFSPSQPVVPKNQIHSVRWTRDLVVVSEYKPSRYENQPP